MPHQNPFPLLFSSRAITNLSKGSISHFAGTGQRGSSDGVGSNASFKNPLGITIDQRTGNLFISSQGDHLIRKITPQGIHKVLSVS